MSIVHHRILRGVLLALGLLCGILAGLCAAQTPALDFFTPGTWVILGVITLPAFLVVPFRIFVPARCPECDGKAYTSKTGPPVMKAPHSTCYICEQCGHNATTTADEIA